VPPSCFYAEYKLWVFQPWKTLFSCQFDGDEQSAWRWTRILVINIQWGTHEI